MKNNLRSVIEYIGLSYKKEMTKLFIVGFVGVLLGVFLFLYTKNYIYPILLIGGLSLYFYVILNGYYVKRSNINKSHDEEFIALLSYFQTFISNHDNVYQAFKKLLSYSSTWMQERINIFLTQIDSDKSVKPYIEFAECFQMKVARNVMLSIYQMVDEGENEMHLLHFTTLFNNIRHTNIEEKKQTQERKLSSVSMFPLIGAGLLTIGLSLAIINAMGDLINVI